MPAQYSILRAKEEISCYLIFVPFRDSSLNASQKLVDEPAKGAADIVISAFVFVF